MKVKIKILREGGKMPSRAHSTDAGYDLFSAQDLVIPPGKTVAVKTGISVEFPPSLVALIWDRSSLSLKGLHRFAGVVDSGYRGEWKVVIHNYSKQKYKIEKGDKIAQVIFQTYHKVNISPSSELSPSHRSKRGFGSTGK